ncbi:metallophosphoesterase [Oceanobacillus halotolerans]|uniref:metallophosphoesterase n=1 Tax=Oceanobacillus halotolerans TaxID=2663380 RepID=UPI0013DCB709|nr:metallophosphoesterase [Oceanobacillus halotolerans]
MKRRTFLKRVFGSILTLAGLSGGTYYYARDIEPTLLEINNQRIRSKKIPKAFHQFKIVQFTDTHLGFHYSIDQFTDLIQTINELSPDMIVFTGDLVDKPDRYNWNSHLIHELKQLEAPYGKYWVYGNHDHGGYGTNILKDVMNQGGFTLLQNESREIKRDNEQFVLAGVDDIILGDPDLDKTLEQIDTNQFTMLLAHEPDFADIAKQYPIDIQLSGHSHGGQIRFPFIGHLYTPVFAEKYIQGQYTFTSNNLHLFVSRGIGTTRLPYRFLCKPEIHLFTLENDE